MKLPCVLGMIALCLGCGGYGPSSNMPPAPGTVPVIAQLSPEETSAGGPGFILTINGSSFAHNAFVNWNGTHPTTMVLTAKQLTAQIPASAIATSGTVAVTVTNPGTPGGAYGGGTVDETSKPKSFTIK